MTDTAAPVVEPTATAPTPAARTVTVEDYGPRNARTDPETGLRTYTWRGHDLWSVTSIRSMAGVPFRLVRWQISKVCDRAVDELDTLNDMMSRPARKRERVVEKNRRKEARSWLRQAAEEERDKAAMRGSAIHKAAELGIAVEDVGDWCQTDDGREGFDLGEGKVVVPAAAIRPKLRQFYAWLEDSGVEILVREGQIWNLTVGYAGSFDILGRQRDGRIVIVDIKTGSSTYSDHVLQQTAYEHGEFIGRDDVIDEAATELLKQVSGAAILHLQDDGWTFIELETGEPAWNAFRGLLLFATWTQGHDHEETYTAARSAGADKAYAAARAERERLRGLHHDIAGDHESGGCDICRLLAEPGAAA